MTCPTARARSHPEGCEDQPRLTCICTGPAHASTTLLQLANALLRPEAEQGPRAMSGDFIVSDKTGYRIRVEQRAEWVIGARLTDRPAGCDAVF